MQPAPFYLESPVGRTPSDLPNTANTPKSVVTQVTTVMPMLPRSARRGNGFKPKHKPMFANFPTKLDRLMQFIEYVRSLTPDPIRTNIEVAECGHKLALAKPPKNNCLDCWQAYFKLNPSVVTGSNTITRVFGYKQLEASKGTKFVKMFQRCIPATNESAAA